MVKKKYVLVPAFALMLFITACNGKNSNVNININDQREELYASTQETTDSPEWIEKLNAAKDEDVTQLFVVAGMGMDKTTATITMHERDEEGKWKQILSTPGFVGKNGLCLDEEHKEGCGQTPVGIYKFNKAFGIADDPGCDIPYVKVDDDTYWSGDDREGMHYNEMVDIKDYPELDMENSEHIVDYDYQYRYCLNISFNEEGTPGRGSAIFLHCFGPLKPYTGGCVALPENIMKLVMQKVKPDCVVIIDTMDDLISESDEEVKEEADEEEDISETSDEFLISAAEEAAPDIDIEGCDTFTQIVDEKLEAGMGYANEKLGDTDVLLVSSATYDNLDGNTAAIDASVFIYKDGVPFEAGKVCSAGTAYPLAVKDGLLYASSGHWGIKYTIRDDRLVIIDKTFVEYDAEGNESYFRESEEGIKEEAKAEFDQYFEDLEDATIIDFQPVGEK